MILPNNNFQLKVVVEVLAVALVVELGWEPEEEELALEQVLVPAPALELDPLAPAARLMLAVSLDSQTIDQLLDCEARWTMYRVNLQIHTFGQIEDKQCHPATPGYNHLTHLASSTRSMRQSCQALMYQKWMLCLPLHSSDCTNLHNPHACP